MRKVIFQMTIILNIILHPPVVMMEIFFTVIQTRKMDIMKQAWQISKDLLWLLVDTIQRQTRPKLMISHPKPGMKLMITRIMISKFIATLSDKFQNFISVFTSFQQSRQE